VECGDLAAKEEVSKKKKKEKIREQTSISKNIQ
jgi:hypothetical protein